MSNKLATVGSGFIFNRIVTVVKINGNIHKIFNNEQVDEYLDCINKLTYKGYKIASEEEGQANVD